MACRCLRVDQLDAHVLDDEIRNIAQDSVDQVIHELPIRFGRFFEKIRPEIKTSVEALLWTHRYFTGASPGQQQMDIAYANYSPNRIGKHFIISVIIPYLSNRFCDISGNIEFSRIYAKVEAVFEAFSLMHLLFFLRNGGHSTIAESILSLRNWNNNQPTISSINYDTQNRELIWNAFRDVVLLVYPFLKVFSEKMKKTRKMRGSNVDGTTLECVECEKPAVIPMIGQRCRHVACYTCVSMRGAMRCPLCENGEDLMVFVAKDGSLQKIG